MSAIPTILPLQMGDRLTRDEFERRYAAMPNLKKAELLEGVVYMPPPVSESFHSTPDMDIISWLAMYRIATPGIVGGANGTVRLDMDNEPQPDAYLRIDGRCGGQARVSEDGYVEGAPELVTEVAASSASYDLHVKLNVYRRNGVREYIVWRVFDKAIDWFVLHEGQYDRMAANSAGVHQSAVLPGLWLDAAAIIRGDLATVHTVARQGIESPEHAAFVARLKESRKT